MWQDLSFPSLYIVFIFTCQEIHGPVVRWFMASQTTTCLFAELLPGDEFICGGMRWIKTGIERGLPLVDVDMAEESLTFEPGVLVEKEAP